MAGEEGYGEEGYTVLGHEHYTVHREHHLVAHLLAFVLGGIAGAGIALLLAPEEGERVRKHIKDVSHQTKEKIGSYYDTAVDTMGARFDKGKELIEQGKPLLSQAIEAGRGAYEREKERVVKLL